MMRNESLILKTLTDQQMTMARCRASSFYVVLALRKCSAGAPFLPNRAAAVCDNPVLENWYQMSYAEFTFPIYLRSFLRTMNLGGYKVFESLNGRSLVPYQAVMKRADWTQCKDDFLAMFNVAGQVYRRALKAEKPKIIDTVQPREIDAQDPPYEPKLEGTQPFRNTDFKVRNTSLEFMGSTEHADGGILPTQGRSLSDSYCACSNSLWS